MMPVKKIIRDFSAVLIRTSGILRLVRETVLKKKVTIIIYHDPKPEMFESHMRYLSKFYNFLPLGRLVDAIRQNDWSDIPQKGLVVTFDDGVKGNYCLLKIFKKYNVHPTIYLCSHIVDTHRKYWFRAGFEDHEQLKRYENKKRFLVLKSTINYEPKNEYEDRQALNYAEIQEMASDVDFQSHTKFHPILTTCTDEECREEIEGSKTFLEDLLSRSIKHLCYPNGDYSDREVLFAEQTGYLSARTVDVGWNDLNSHPLKLKAMYIDDDASLHILNVQLLGIFSYVRYFRSGSLKGKHPPYI